MSLGGYDLTGLQSDSYGVVQNFNFIQLKGVFDE